MCGAKSRATAQTTQAHLTQLSLRIMTAECDKVNVVEPIIFNHADPESGNTSRFAGSKERLRIGILTKKKKKTVALKSLQNT